MNSDDAAEDLRRVQTQYQAGKATFERGDYRQSVQHLEKAVALLARNSRLGGEVQIWLVTAYEATGQRAEAIALCRQLTRHPHWETRKQSRRLLYILEAPQLVRRPEWLTKIPDLSRLADNEAPAFYAQVPAKKRPTKPQRPPMLPEPVDLSQVNTQDNQFLWVALGSAMVMLVGLLWLS
ncbi:hypothetical protein DO97_16635 [Neosynechococcus sphagnicola sy1]|uniref:Uncharacterized protein n=1 Tax=Neosynechococcus sphagnicola sy1 TaxID=1497020 RepID=A0A098TMY5_9CYAN|nr:bacterial transcriptional activator domain-containing protein [Neosynechococcus sphagnicola]KGF73606.1 hypothetical protein DO97_16635 [Neosynechococcus sphagnicola sy1]